jgi:pimeloyl-ACP methyl ester carboxylesterase
MGKCVVAILLSLMILLVALPRETSASMGPCCEFAVYTTDTQPKPGERVDYTGIITDQFGGGEGDVQIQYQDPALFQSSSQNATSDTNGAWHLSVTMPIVYNDYTTKFTITMTDSAASWSTALSDSYGYTSPSGDVPALYESEFQGKMNAYINIQSVGFPAIMFLSGGYEQPILSGVSELDQNTITVLTSIANAGYNVIAPIGWFVNDLPIFPFILAALLKYGMRIGQVYLIGWSAGGTVAAWTLTHDNYRIFDLGVIMDAELEGSANSTQTDSSVFTTAQLSNLVKVPHLLIWGANEAGTTSIQSAMLWTKNAPSNMVRLDPFAYSHLWIGTGVQPEILADILNFFKSNQVGTISFIHTEASNGTVGSLNAAIPKSAMDGQLVVLLDNNTVTVPYWMDASYYHIYLTYSASTHVIVIGGENTVPEFTNPIYQLLAFMVSLVTVLIIMTLSKSTKVRTSSAG